MNCKRKSRRRFFLLMRSRTPPISSKFRGGFNTPNPPRYATDPDRAVWISWPHSVRFFFVVLDEERSLQKKGGYSRGIAGWHSGWCWLHNETWRSTETNNTRSSHTSCKVNWGRRWDLRKFILTWNKICHLYIKLELKYNEQQVIFLYYHSQCFCICGFKQPYPGNN